MSSELLTSPRHGGLKATMRLVIYAIDDQRYALQLSAVERVVPVVEITPLSKAPAHVVGVINVQGRIIPVLDCRARCGLPAREVELSDQLLVARIARRTVALLVDHVDGVIECSLDEVVPAAHIVTGMNVEGALKLPDGSIVLIEDLDQAFSHVNTEQLEFGMKMS